MPALYAHDRFGRIVFQRLDGELHDIIAKYYTQFQVGLQGPDIFFFYKAWKSNRVTKYGFHLHEISAKPFFEHAVSVIHKHGRDSAEYAYLLGFLCHYILDSECHHYVEEMVRVTGAQHLEVEEEFEKMLLRKDHRDPIAYPLCKLLPTDNLTAKSIYSFYEHIDPPTVKTSLQCYKLIKWFFTAPGRIHQFLINTGMKLMGVHKNYLGLMHQRKDNPDCQQSNEGLYLRFHNAIPVALEMMQDYDQTILGQKVLNLRFDRNFE